MTERAALNARFNPTVTPLRVSTQIGSNVKGNNMQQQPLLNSGRKLFSNYHYDYKRLPNLSLHGGNQHHRTDYEDARQYHRRYHDHPLNANRYPVAIVSRNNHHHRVRDRSRSPIRPARTQPPAQPPNQPNQPPAQPPNQPNQPPAQSPAQPQRTPQPLPPPPPPAQPRHQPLNLTGMLPRSDRMFDSYDETLTPAVEIPDDSKMFPKDFVKVMVNASRRVPPEPTFTPDDKFLEELFHAVAREDLDALDKLALAGTANTDMTTIPVDIKDAVQKYGLAVTNGRWPTRQCIVSAALAMRKGFSASCTPYNPYTLVNTVSFVDQHPASLRIGVGVPRADYNDAWYCDEQVTGCCGDAKMIAERRAVAYQKLPGPSAVRAVLEADLPYVRCKLPDDFSEDLNLDYIYDEHQDGSIFPGLHSFQGAFQNARRICAGVPLVIHCKKVTGLLQRADAMYATLAAEAGYTVDISKINEVDTAYASSVGTLAPCVELMAAAKKYAVARERKPAQMILGAVGGPNADSAAFYEGMALSNIDEEFLKKMCAVASIKYDMLMEKTFPFAAPDTKIRQAYAFAFKIIDLILQMLTGPLGYKSVPTDQAELALRTKLVRQLHTADLFGRLMWKLNPTKLDRVKAKVVKLSDPTKRWADNKALYAKFDNLGDHINTMLLSVKGVQLYFDTGTTVNVPTETGVERAAALLAARKTNNHAHFAVCHLKAQAGLNSATADNGTLFREDYKRTDTRPNEVVMPSSADTNQFVQAITKLKGKLVF
ncbi:hypothetical protein [Cyprinid herpesvirus 3]|uniref:Uncharacterized protein n=1 Tax=Cyprinid herpesvirus 3 TaxID=180230 RepID=Q75N32_CYHV3|nr:hypothetical protein [Cyprinid herpesvirus 3]BAF48897.1 hypothetical protein [Cyprinid herpesvirus 3]